MAATTRKRRWELSPPPSTERSFSPVPSSPATGDASIGRLFSPPIRPLLWELISAAGGLFTPWVPESPNSGPLEDSVARPPAPSLCSQHPSQAFPRAQPTPSPDPPDSMGPHPASPHSVSKSP